MFPLRPIDLPEWAPRFIRSPWRCYWRRMAIVASADIVIATMILVTWSAASGWHIYRWLRQMIVGLDYLVLSFLVFALAFS